MRSSFTVALACSLCALGGSSGAQEGPLVTNTPPMPGFSWVLDQRLAAMPQPGGQRPLELDVAFLRERGIQLLVSLTEEPTDPGVLAEAGISTLHLPVPDFTAPSLQQLRAFLDAVNASLESDRPVGVHCTAGLGRSGTFLAAYFVSLGDPAIVAIDRVRRLRPGSIETVEQERRIAELEDLFASTDRP